MARELVGSVLLRALNEGPAVLPDDAWELLHLLQIIEQLLAEKASNREANWREACVAATEIETLQSIEALIAARAAALRGRDIEEVRAKLEIWSLLEEQAAGSEESLTLLIASIRRDVICLAGEGTHERRQVPDVSTA
jgi:hypothetical protein